MLRTPRFLSVCLAALLLLGAASDALAETETHTSGVLNAGREQRFDCNLTNRTDDDVDVTIAILSPSGAVLAGPADFTAAPGETVALSHEAPKPGDTAYCESEVPAGADVVSNFAVSTKGSRPGAQANSPLLGPRSIEPMVVVDTSVFFQVDPTDTLHCTSDHDFLVHVLLERLTGSTVVHLKFSEPGGSSTNNAFDVPGFFTIGGRAGSVFELGTDSGEIRALVTLRTRPHADWGCSVITP